MDSKGATTCKAGLAAQGANVMSVASQDYGPRAWVPWPLHATSTPRSLKVKIYESERVRLMVVVQESSLPNTTALVGIQCRYH